MHLQSVRNSRRGKHSPLFPPPPTPLLPNLTRRAFHSHSSLLWTPPSLRYCVYVCLCESLITELMPVSSVSSAAHRLVIRPFPHISPEPTTISHLISHCNHSSLTSASPDEWVHDASPSIPSLHSGVTSRGRNSPLARKFRARKWQLNCKQYRIKEDERLG